MSMMDHGPLARQLRPLGATILVWTALSSLASAGCLEVEEDSFEGTLAVGETLEFKGANLLRSPRSVYTLELVGMQDGGAYLFGLDGPGLNTARPGLEIYGWDGTGWNEYSYEYYYPETATHECSFDTWDDLTDYGLSCEHTRFGDRNLRVETEMAVILPPPDGRYTRYVAHVDGSREFGSRGTISATLERWTEAPRANLCVYSIGLGRTVFYTCPSNRGCSRPYAQVSDEPAVTFVVPDAGVERSPENAGMVLSCIGECLCEHRLEDRW